MMNILNLFSLEIFDDINLASIKIFQLAQAGNPDSTSPPSAGSSILGMLPTFILMIIIFYFFLIRPQKLKQKKLEEKVSSLKKGDKIITAGGIHGIVESLRDKTVLIRIANGLNIELEKNSVSIVLAKEQKTGVPKK